MNPKSLKATVVTLDLTAYDPSVIADRLRNAGLSELADQIEAQTRPPRIPEPTEPLTEVMASTNRRERRKFVRGLNPLNGRARWVDGVASWSWDELIDPTLIREGLS